MADKRQRSPSLENLMYHRLNVLWQGIDGWIRWTVVGLGAPILALALVYWGYCWHWWGRDTLALQYLFQCRCPPASEAARYPNFTVLVSACQSAWIHSMAPSGQALLVETTARPRISHLDISTGQEQIFPFDPMNVSRISFIDDQRFLVRLSRNTGYLVYDQQQQVHLPVPAIYFDAQEAQVQEVLHTAQEVLLFNSEVLVLASNYRQQPDNNAVLTDVNAVDVEQINTQLQPKNMRATPVHPPYQADRSSSFQRYSPDGRFTARRDGIYHTDTQEQIISTDLPFFDRISDFDPVGWTTGQRGVVYAGRTAYVIDNTNDYAIPYSWLPVPQPQLLLELPEEFWAE
ncbi:MAG: hypothetical protein AAGF95_29200 [Chloroflexota bacterium]